MCDAQALKGVHRPCSQSTTNKQATCNMRWPLCICSIRDQCYSLKDMFKSNLQKLSAVKISPNELVAQTVENYLELISINNDVVITPLKKTCIKVVFLAQFNNIFSKHFIPLFHLLVQFSINL